ncbi:ABC transporter-like protein [Rhodovulum sulfidophilum]|uniref:ABC transporter-like protein n=1 Tax=Rhodovulum sulfidophilum TaxID=35806 RepID=A0A0D6B3S9_RHOSU|nr:ABC transporter-like protein [Rhodovulum sulfidophilum]
MDAIIELTSLGAAKYGGNYSAFRQRRESERAAAAQDLAHAQKLRAEAAHRAQQAAERKARKDSAGRKSRTRGDQPKILMDAAKGRAEASGGAGARLRDARRDAAEDVLTAAREKVEVLTPIHMDIAPSGLPAGRIVLTLDRVTAGYDPAVPVFEDLSLPLTGPERVVIAGPNGSGKTTLLKLITGALRPMAGLKGSTPALASLGRSACHGIPSSTARPRGVTNHPWKAARSSGDKSAAERWP